MKKPFDKTLYDIADTTAKQKMIGWLEHTQPKCTVNSEETTYFDLTVKTDDGGGAQLYEVEIKYAWKEEWPSSWTELRIPYRKKRLLDRWKDKHRNCLFTFIIVLRLHLNMHHEYKMHLQNIKIKLVLLLH